VVYRCPAVCVMRISSDGSVNPAHAPIFFGAQDVGFWDGPDLSLSATASTMSLTPMIATNPIGSEGFLLLSNTGLYKSLIVFVVYLQPIDVWKDV
jgi:hypothetical protein